jgi:dTMP kinase
VNGKFLVFEGGEGCGKSTQAARLAERIGAVLTRQPGGTQVGGAIRGLLLDPATVDLSIRAEALLMAADRAHHVAELIRPTLAAGQPVVCDRYTYSSIAYQGYGRGLDPTEVAQISAWATQDLWPDVVVLLDVDPEVAHARIARERDRFELAGSEFHARVRDGFLQQAAADPPRWVVIDGAGTPDEVEAEIWNQVADRLR